MTPYRPRRLVNPYSRGLSGIDIELTFSHPDGTFELGKERTESREEGMGGLMCCSDRKVHLRGKRAGIERATIDSTLNERWSDGVTRDLYQR